MNPTSYFDPSLTFDSVTLGDADDVDHLILGEDVLDGDRLLHETTSEVHLLGNRAAVQLNLVNVGLLLALAEQLDLYRMGRKGSQRKAGRKEGKTEGKKRGNEGRGKERRSKS